MELPDVAELPDETQRGEYVTTLGKIIPFPQNYLSINPKLLQRDVDITIMDRIKTTGNKVGTLPCLIKLRHQDTKDINKWQSKEVQLVSLPDETIHITGGENKAQDIM